MYRRKHGTGRGAFSKAVILELSVPRNQLESLFKCSQQSQLLEETEPEKEGLGPGC